MVNNPYIIIQARMNSERLPGKVLKPIDGIPMIGILIERLKQSGIPIILATSTNTDNDVLVDFVINYGVSVFRGSEDNVLERYYLAAKTVNADPIIRLTGDNPLLEGKLVKEVLNFYLKQNNSKTYLSTGLSKTYPLGISIEIFSFELLEEANFNANHPGELEHVTPYMHQNKPGNINIIPYRGKMDRYNYRLTVDTKEDLELHKILIEKYRADKMSIDDIISILDIHPELQKINNWIHQKPIL